MKKFTYLSSTMRFPSTMRPFANSSISVRTFSTSNKDAFKKREKAFEEKEMRKHNQELLDKLKEKLRLEKEKAVPNNKDKDFIIVPDSDK